MDKLGDSRDLCFRGSTREIKPGHHKLAIPLIKHGFKSVLFTIKPLVYFPDARARQKDRFLRQDGELVICIVRNLGVLST